MVSVRKGKGACEVHSYAVQLSLAEVYFSVAVQIIPPVNSTVTDWRTGRCPPTTRCMENFSAHSLVPNILT